MAWISDALLTAVAAAGRHDCLTVPSLRKLTGLDATAVYNACTLLVKHGLMVKTNRGCHQITHAGVAAVEQNQVVRPGKQAPNEPRQKAWHVFRLKGKASLNDVRLLASTGDERAFNSALGKYLRALERAGYLQRLSVREPRVGGGGAFIRYRLARDSGPQAPVWRAIDKTVFDPNTNEVHACG